MRDSPIRTDNVVAQLKSPRRRTPRLPRALTRGALGIVVLAIVVGIFCAPSHQWRAACLVLLIAGGLGWAIAWLSGTHGRLSESGREMGDFWKNDDGMPRS